MKIDSSQLASNQATASFLSLVGADKSNIVHLNIQELTPYPNQPFQVRDGEQLQDLAEDIKENGVLFPVIVRPLDGKYQILAGHRRTRASEWAGKETVPCIIKEVDDAGAKLIVTNTNLTQRQELLPSERAFAYRMQKEAYEELGTHAVRTTARVAEEAGEKARMIQYYLNLTELVPALLQQVDEKILTVKTGSLLARTKGKREQELLAAFLQKHGKPVSEKQGLKIAALTQVTQAALESILLTQAEKAASEEKQKPVPTTITESNFSGLQDALSKINCLLGEGTALDETEAAQLERHLQTAQSSLEKLERLVRKAKGKYEGAH